MVISMALLGQKCSSVTQDSIKSSAFSCQTQKVLGFPVEEGLGETNPL